MISIQKLFFENVNYSNIILVTSNINKLNEFKQLGLKNIKIEKGIDLPEVDSDDVTVIKYKALHAGINRLVDDTSLNVENESIGVNIRWLLNNLSKLNNRKANWKVLLGYNNGKHIYVYEGIVYGIIKSPSTSISKDDFGFDPYFIPINNNPKNLSLKELDNLGKKNNYSARNYAVLNFLKNKYVYKFEISKIPEWKGKYQH